MSLLRWLNELPCWRQCITVDGAKLRASSLDRLVYLGLHKLGRMGADERAFFQRHVRPGMTVVEAGSNVGVYTLLFSRLVGPEGKVFAFEPDPRIGETLRQNLAQNSAANVTLHACALGAKSEERLLQRVGLNSGDNRLLAEPHAANSDAATATVKVAALDDLLCGEKVDFVKMDVQGWEWEVLRGMKETLKANPRMELFLEYWPYGLRSAGFEPLEGVRMLEQDGWLLRSGEAERPFSLADAAAFDDGSQRFMNIYASRG